jgi:hypothetical protein
MKITKIHCRINLYFAVILHCAFFFSICAAQSNKAYNLKYRFEKKDKLQYKIQQFDSTEYHFQDDIFYDTVIRQKLLTLSIFNISKKNEYSITVTMDSTVTQRNRFFEQNTEHLLFLNSDLEVDKIRITTDIKGRPLRKNDRFIPILIPLPEYLIMLNQDWHFQFKNDALKTELFKGKTEISGHCLFYDIQEMPTDTIAMIMLEIESRTEGKFKLVRSYDTIECDYLRNQSSTNLIYFNISKSHIIKIVTTMETEELRKNRSLSMKIVYTSRLFANLIEH